jgi:hypothetical protein
MMTRLMAALLVCLLASPAAAQTPSNPDVWRDFASKIDVGSRVKVRLADGKRLTATLIQAAPADLVVQPRTRIPVPVQRVPYDAIVSLERDEARGIGAGKAVAIGVAAGVGAFLGTLLLVIATID